MFVNGLGLDPSNLVGYLVVDILDRLKFKVGILRLNPTPSLGITESQLLKND